jgi:hypothetical protein
MTRKPKGWRCAFAAVAMATGTILVQPQRATAGMVTGTSCPTFPDDSWWHADVSGLPVHARSAQWMDRMQSSRNLHPDFGKSFGAQPAPYGIPITVVDGSHAKVKVRFDYDDESDKIRYPLGSDTQVEGGQWKTGDRHTAIATPSWSTATPAGFMRPGRRGGPAHRARCGARARAPRGA